MSPWARCKTYKDHRDGVLGGDGCGSGGTVPGPGRSVMGYVVQARWFREGILVTCQLCTPLSEDGDRQRITPRDEGPTFWVGEWGCEVRHSTVT